MELEVTGTELAVCELIAERQQLGIAKYGQTVADNPLELRAWLQHTLEETLDQAIYLKRAIEEIDAKLQTVSEWPKRFPAVELSALRSEYMNPITPGSRKVEISQLCCKLTLGCTEHPPWWDISCMCDKCRSR